MHTCAAVCTSWHACLPCKLSCTPPNSSATSNLYRRAIPCCNLQGPVNIHENVLRAMQVPSKRCILVRSNAASHARLLGMARP